MNDLIYVDLEMKNCPAQQKDGQLWNDVQEFRIAMINFVTNIRKQIGAFAISTELCRNVAFYLQKCLTESDLNVLKENKLSWACDLDKTAFDNLNVIKLYIQHPQIRSLALRIHRGYLGHIAKEFILTKLHLQKHRSPSHIANTDKEHQEIVSQLEIPKSLRP